MIRPLYRIAALLFCMSLGGAASAEQATFVLRFAGIKLGVLSYADTVGPSSYAARLRFQTGGLSGLLSSVTFDAQSQGNLLASGAVSPVKYREESLRDGDREVTEITWRGEKPDIVVENPPQPDRLDPREAVGSIDFMSGMHLLLRAVPPADACSLDTTTYDGKRLMRLRLGQKSKDRAGRLTCKGTFSRLKGVAPEGLFDTILADFEMIYRTLDDGRVRVDRMGLKTPLGRAILAIE